ncbi:hypothetical protein, partial [Corallococcus terminator]
PYVLDRTAAVGWLVGNFDRAYFVSPGRGTSDFSSVRRGATGACESVALFAVPGYTLLLADRITGEAFPFAIPAPLNLQQ